MTIACAGEDGATGPVGPQGLQGERGEQGLRGEVGHPGQDGMSGFDILLIERTFSSDDYDEDQSSFYIRNADIEPGYVTGVYVKAFYTNTGDAYYTPIHDWAEINVESPRLFLFQILSGELRLFDMSKDLLNETVVVSIIK